MKKRAQFWLLLNVVVLLVLGVRVREGLHFESDLLKLLPRTEQNPLAEKVIRSFSEMTGNRVVFVLGNEEVGRARDAARVLVKRLEASPYFKEVNGELPSDDGRGFYSLFFPHKMALLEDTVVDELLSAKGVEDFLSRKAALLYSPMGSSLSPLLAGDPLLLFPDWLQTLPSTPGESVFVDGFLQVEDEGLTYVLVTCRTMHSPFARAYQAEAVEGVKVAEAFVLEAFPDVCIEKTGVLFFAHAGAQSAEGEIRVIGLGSLVGVVLLIFLAFRSVRYLLLSLLPLLSGFLFALTASVYCFSDLHLVTLGFGASLIGVCVDYSFHFFSESLGKKGRIDGGDVLRAVFPGISLGLITSVLAYMGLFMAPFPGLRQMAVFSSVGLLGAFGSVVCWFPFLVDGRRNRYTPKGLLRFCEVLLGAWHRVSQQGLVVGCLVLVGLFVLAGWGKLVANDDVRALQSPSGDLMAHEGHIRRLMGDLDASRFFMIEGGSEEAVLRSGESLSRSLERLRGEGALSFYHALSQWVPSLALQQGRRGGFAKSLREHEVLYEDYFSSLGFSEDTYIRLLAEVSTNALPLTVSGALSHDVSDSFRHLWLGGVDGRYVSVILLGGVRDQAALIALEKGDASITYVNKVDDVSLLFKRYRVLSGWLIFAAYFFIGLFVCWRYGWRKGLRVFIPPCLAMLLTFGVLGHLGHGVTLFNVLALLLVLGVGIDYTIFFAESRSDVHKIMMAVLLSSFTTLLSFALLSLSQTEALSTFGVTVLVGVVLALVFAPFASGVGEKKGRLKR